ncbi:hypothetical protein ACJMK2_025016 [Sinanodonta woodiana]|uniref:TLDc domain-containing protein n=1 Tax=Sinanodonta woodiana TaxID=1069815 RepID=A0ABD3XI63_SINWO
MKSASYNKCLFFLQRSSQENKFLVAESALLSLFSVCCNCGNGAQGVINIVQKCDFCSHKGSWNSQPFVRFIKAVNQLLFCLLEAIPPQAVRIFEFLKMTHTNIDTFVCIKGTTSNQQLHIFWKQKQEGYFEEVWSGGGSIVAVDDRADSPDHSAMYGIYSSEDVNTGKVVNMEIV